MSSLIDIAQNICDNINSRVKSQQDSRGKIFYKPITYKDSIIKIYSTYEGPKDFLRIPTGEKIDCILTGDNCVFLGAYLNGRLAGISYLKEIPENYPFFRAPLSEGKMGKVFTFGGLYVRPECQGFGSATGMVGILTESARKYIDARRASGEQNLPQGIFFEADYRNVGSISVLARHGNYVGFYVDEKRLEGPTIMLYDSFRTQPIVIGNVPKIHIPEDKEEGIVNLTEFTSTIAEQVGGSTEYTIPFDDQSNHMVVLNNIPLTTPVSKGMFEFEKEYRTQFVNYKPGEAREVMTGSSEEKEATIIEMPPREALDEVKKSLDIPQEQGGEGDGPVQAGGGSGYARITNFGQVFGRVSSMSIRVPDDHGFEMK